MFLLVSSVFLITYLTNTLSKTLVEMTQNTNIKISAIRSSFLDFISDPFYYPELETVRYINDGLMIISDQSTVCRITYS